MRTRLHVLVYARDEIRTQSRTKCVVLLLTPWSSDVDAGPTQSITDFWILINGIWACKRNEDSKSALLTSPLNQVHEVSFGASFRSYTDDRLDNQWWTSSELRKVRYRIRLHGSQLTLISAYLDSFTKRRCGEQSVILSRLECSFRTGTVLMTS